MEPAPLTADEIVAPIAPPPLPGLDLGDRLVADGLRDRLRDRLRDPAMDAPHAAGEDIEPPYLRLRTLVDETLLKENQDRDGASPYPPDLDLTEFATLAEKTGVEVVASDAPPLPRTLIADVASFPHAMPTSIEPATELVVTAKSRLSFSRTRLVGWGSVAFCAGLLASAGAHMLVAPAHLGPTANAATVTASQNAAPVAPAPSATAPAAVVAVAPAPAIAVVPVAAPAIAVVPVPAPTADAPAAKSTAPETAPAEAPHPTVAASSSPIRTRSGANALSRGQMRARGKIRSRGGSASAAEIAGETDAPSSDAPAADAAPAPAARPTLPAPGWVDPFAQ
jgi:hypothetical protein